MRQKLRQIPTSARPDKMAEMGAVAQEADRVLASVMTQLALGALASRAELLKALPEGVDVLSQGTSELQQICSIKAGHRHGDVMSCLIPSDPELIGPLEQARLDHFLLLKILELHCEASALSLLICTQAFHGLAAHDRRGGITVGSEARTSFVKRLSNRLRHGGSQPNVPWRVHTYRGPPP